MSTYYKRLATIIRAFPVIRDLSYCFFYGSICLCFVDKSTRNQRQVTGCHLSVKFVCGKLHDSNYSKQIFQCRRQTTSLILFDHSVMIIYDGRSKLRFFFPTAFTKLCLPGQRQLERFTVCSGQLRIALEENLSQRGTFIETESRPHQAL